MNADVVNANINPINVNIITAILVTQTTSFSEAVGFSSF